MGRLEAVLAQRAEIDKKLKERLVALREQVEKEEKAEAALENLLSH